MSDESQYERYKKAIARIYRAGDGAVVGSGVLVFERYVLTCAHVVADALNIKPTAQDCPECWVELDFPISDARHQLKIQAKVVCWRPISLSGKWERGDDIAALELQEELIADICPVGLALAGSPMNKFQTLGFPVGYDDGVWTHGEFRGEQGTGWVQIVVTNQSDYFVEGGFSGAPVWDETIQAVAGIIVAAELNNDNEKRKLVKAAFMIPAKVLGEFWEDLKPHIKQPNQDCIDADQSFNAQTIADLLTNLNYDRQKSDFKESMNRLQTGSAFLITAKDLQVQRWLVRSLSQMIPGFEPAEKISINVTSYRSQLNPDPLWQELGKKLTAFKNRDQVIQDLSAICQKKSVIIAIYNFRELEEQIADLYDFWCDLLQAVEQLPYRHARSRLILLLTDEEIENYAPFQIVKSQEVQNSQELILLDLFTNLDTGTVRGWLSDDCVCNLLGEERVNFILQQRLKHWKKEPLKMLQQICAVFNFDGIAEIENYWKLAG